MEIKIVIFLAFTSVTLIFNSVVIYMAYKAYSRAALKVTETIREFETSESALIWLRALESASSQAVILTDAAKNHLAAADPVLTEAQAKYSFRLAQLDLHMERSLSKVVGLTQKMHGGVGRPAHRIGATLSGIREVLRVLSDRQTSDDATPTQR